MQNMDIRQHVKSSRRIQIIKSFSQTQSGLFKKLLNNSIWINFVIACKVFKSRFS